jgi:DNA (cytosine-5)-methyltransferase 1
MGEENYTGAICRRNGVSSVRSATRREKGRGVQGFPAISLFSGAGGMDSGLRNAGFSVKVAVDNKEEMCLTYARNFPDAIVVGPPDGDGDVRELSGESLLDLAGIRRGELALLVGGPPCQPFSIAANQRFMKSDSRFKRQGFEDAGLGTLIDEFVRLVGETRPEAFILENVPGLLQIDSGLKLQQVVLDLSKAGYAVSSPVVAEAAEYGVPQMRKRLFLLGVRGGRSPLSFPHPQFGSRLFSQQPYRTVAHAICGLKVSALNHVARDHKDESIARYRRLKFGQREHLGRVDRLDPRKPSKTVIAGGSNGGGRSHLHPYLARTITVREDARLQTFEDDFGFEGTIARQFTQVGNAVPPLLAETIGRHVLKEAFGASVDPEPIGARYLDRPESIQELCHLLLEQAVSERPDWIYDDVLVAARELDQEVG